MINLRGLQFDKFNGAKSLMVVNSTCFPRRYFFCGSFMFLCCLVFAMSLCASVYMCFVVTCWERADLLALFGVSSVSLSLSHWYPGSGVVLDCINS